jgi:hypothetical protein
MSEKDTAAQRRAEYVAALKVEREGYVRSGKADRVKQVDEQLARYAAGPQRTPQTRVEKRPAKKAESRKA